MTTYAALSTRIRSANTRAELAAKDKQITKHYEAGTITVSQFARLYDLIIDKLAIIDTNTTNEHKRK